MSIEQLKAFRSKVDKDDNLQNKLKAAKSPEDVVGIAKNTVTNLLLISSVSSVKRSCKL